MPIHAPVTVVAASAILGTALLAYHSTAVQAARSPQIHRCASTQLVVQPTTVGLGAAAGHVGRWYRMHRLWGPSCSLQGSPGVVLLDRHFHSLPIHVGRGGYIIPAHVRAHRVILDRQHDAFFALEYTDVRTCRSAPYLMIIPPSDRLPIVAFSGGLAPCPGDIDVSPVESAPSLP